MKTEIVNKIRKNHFITDSKIGYQYRENYAFEMARAASVTIDKLKEEWSEGNILEYLDRVGCYPLWVYRTVVSEAIDEVKKYRIASDRYLYDIARRM
ncbi:hypothetical protein EZS27_004096 [termite gut metagenome]|uniref:Uncharacterized protein n=1 Tax=termite gut metagenome TaxID=433724 RepID=A0A5J4SQY2_9ZZZZ